MGTRQSMMSILDKRSATTFRSRSFRPQSKMKRGRLSVLALYKPVWSSNKLYVPDQSTIICTEEPES